VPAEQQLWEGAPSLRALTADLVSTLLFTLALAIGVAVVFAPLLASIAKISDAVARAIAHNMPGLRLAAIVFVVFLAGQRIVRLVWRGLVLRALSYRLSNQRLLVESGVFSRTIEEIDLRTVDDLTFHQRFFERLLGLGRIGIVSSEPDPQGGLRRAGTRAELIGIPDPRAVREIIRNAAYEASGKQVFMRPT
jgi:PH (Pleckstrin Homology) domain-containing protein